MRTRHIPGKITNRTRFIPDRKKKDEVIVIPGELVHTSAATGWLNSDEVEAGLHEDIWYLNNSGNYPGRLEVAMSYPACFRHTGKNYLLLSHYYSGNTVTSPVNGPTAQPDWIIEIDGTFFNTVGTQYIVGNSNGAFGILNDQLYFTIPGANGGLGVIPMGDQVIRFVGYGNSIHGYYKSGTSWIDAGTPWTVNTTANFASLIISPDSNRMKGRIFRLRMWAGIDDSVIPFFDCNFEKFSHGQNYNYANTGQKVTINQANKFPSMIVGKSLMWFDGSGDSMTLSASLWSGNEPRSMVVVYQQSPNRLTTNMNVAGQGSGDGPAYSFFKIASVGATDPKGDPLLHLYAGSLNNNTPPVFTRKIAIATYDGSTIKLYKDGVLIDSDSITLSSDADDFTIGADDPTATYFAGFIEDVYAYNVELSPAEVTAITNSLRLPYHAPVQPKLQLLRTSVADGWLNAAGEPAKYLEPVQTLDNKGTVPFDIRQPDLNQKPKCIRHEGTNFLHHSGENGNNASVPDSPELDIKGDITLEWEGRLNGLPRNTDLIGKSQFSNQISYSLCLGISGIPFFVFSGDGVNAGIISCPNPITFNVNVILGIRLIRQGGNYNFYTRIDGGSWSLLGTATGTTGLLFSGTSNIELGGCSWSQGPMLGATYRAKIWNNSTPNSTNPVLDIDFKYFAHGATSGRALTGHVVTINASGVNPAYIVGKSLMFFDGGDDWMTLGSPLFQGNDARSMVVVYNNTIITTGMTIVGQGDGIGDGNDFFELACRTDPGSTGDPYLVAWGLASDLTDGSAPTVTRKIAIVTHDGTTTKIYKNGTLVASAARAFNTDAVDFKISSPDGASPSQFAGYIEDIQAYNYALTDSEVTTITNSLAIAPPPTPPTSQILKTTPNDWKTAAGTTAGYLDMVAKLENTGTFGGGIFQSDTNAQPRCIRHSGTNFLHLPGVTGNYALVPDSPELDISVDIDIRVKVDYRVGVKGWLITKDDPNVDPGGRSWAFMVAASGQLYIELFPDAMGSTHINANSDTGVLSDGIQWARFTFDADNGAGGNDIKFYKSTDGVTWTQLGPTVTNVGIRKIGVTNTPILIGARVDSFPLLGGIYRVQIFASLNETYKQLDIDFSYGNHGYTSLKARTGQTITINQAGERPAYLVGRSMLALDGTRWMTFGRSLWTGNHKRTMVVAYTPANPIPDYMSVCGQSGFPYNGTWFNFTISNIPPKGDAALDFGNPYVTDLAVPNTNRKIMVATYDGSKSRLYKDGVEIGNLDFTLNTNNSEFLVGVANTGGLGAYFHGYIEDIYAYDYDLSPAEVTTITNSLKLAAPQGDPPQEPPVAPPVP